MSDKRILFNEEKELYIVYRYDADGEVDCIAGTKDRREAEEIAGIKYVPLQFIQQELNVFY